VEGLVSFARRALTACIPWLASGLWAALAASTAGCGHAPPRAVVAATGVEPHWQDVFETTPELLFVLRPTALAKDKVYGPLLRRILEAARERSRVVAATRVLEVVQEADEVVLALRPSERGGDEPAEVVVVVRGVPSNVDPAKVVDADGRPLWSPGPNGPVRELVRERDEHGHPLDASLFELEGLTWVIAVGDARTRAREVFAHPLGRPELQLDPGALAMVRIDGTSLVKHIHALQPLGGLSAVGRKLQSLTALLPPGSDGSLQLALAYTEEDAAAFSEVAARQAIEVIGRKKPESLAWLASAKVERPDKRVMVTLPLPPRLIDSLLHAGTAPIDFEPGAP
jgi:hypothetical protein